MDNDETEVVTKELREHGHMYAKGRISGKRLLMRRHLKRTKNIYVRNLEHFLAHRYNKF